MILKKNGVWVLIQIRCYLEAETICEIAIIFVFKAQKKSGTSVINAKICSDILKEVMLAIWRLWFSLVYSYHLLDISLRILQLGYQLDIFSFPKNIMRFKIHQKKLYT